MSVKNLLMIVVDDLRPELGCFGKKKLHTPNIDRLASRATVYERAYCQYPQCMPSRTSVMCGKRPPKFCNWTNLLLQPGEVTLPGHLKQNGVKTVSIGKIYHEPVDDAFSWDELHAESFRALPLGGFENAKHDYQLPENQAKTEYKETLPLSQIRKMHEGLPPLSECADAPEENYLDGKVAAKAVNCIERHRESDRPLFLSVGFTRPHLPWNAPKKYWDLYDRDAVDLADNPFFPKNAVAKSNLCDFLHYGDAEVDELFNDLGRYEDEDFPVLSEAKQRECIHAYWASVSFMDAQVGKVLDALEANGMAEETAVILWGDNGWHLGEHKLWSKITHFDESTRVPLLLSVPGQQGQSTRSLVELVDVFPTACQLLGLEMPEQLEGEVLPGTAGEAAVRGKKHVFAANWSGHTVLSERYRFTHYPEAAKGGPLFFQGRGDIELFDHQNDPQENENIAADPANAEVITHLRQRLREVYPL